MFLATLLLHRQDRHLSFQSERNAHPIDDVTVFRIFAFSGLTRALVRSLAGRFVLFTPSNLDALSR